MYLCLHSSCQGIIYRWKYGNMYNFVFSHEVSSFNGKQETLPGN